MLDKNVNEILKLHDYASEFVNKPISIFDAVEVAKAIKNLRLSPAKIDIGKLVFEFHKKAPEHDDIFTFISKKLKPHKKQKPIIPKNVVLYGFSRIGRLLARELMLQNGKGNQLRLRAILNLELHKKTSVFKLNNILKRHALEGGLVEQIKYELSDELVSSDIIGSSAPAIFDSKATLVRNNGKNAIIYIWYDNEYGYSHQVLRLPKYITEVRRFTYY